MLPVAGIRKRETESVTAPSASLRVLLSETNGVRSLNVARTRARSLDFFFDPEQVFSRNARSRLFDLRPQLKVVLHLTVYYILHMERTSDRGGRIGDLTSDLLLIGIEGSDRWTPPCPGMVPFFGALPTMASRRAWLSLSLRCSFFRAGQNWKRFPASRCKKLSVTHEAEKNNVSLIDISRNHSCIVPTRQLISISRRCLSSRYRVSKLVLPFQTDCAQTILTDAPFLSYLHVACFITPQRNHSNIGIPKNRPQGSWITDRDDRGDLQQVTVVLFITTLPDLFSKRGEKVRGAVRKGHGRE